jgi:hypothetical protein
MFTDESTLICISSRRFSTRNVRPRSLVGGMCASWFECPRSKKVKTKVIKEDAC